MIQYQSPKSRRGGSNNRLPWLSVIKLLCKQENININNILELWSFLCGSPVSWHDSQLVGLVFLPPALCSGQSQLWTERRIIMSSQSWINKWETKAKKRRKQKCVLTFVMANSQNNQSKKWGQDCKNYCCLCTISAADHAGNGFFSSIMCPNIYLVAYPCNPDWRTVFNTYLTIAAYCLEF